MIISKSEAKKRGLRFGEICHFHLNNPDQAGVYACEKCIIIQDKCGCDEDMGCEKCGEPL